MIRAPLAGSFCGLLPGSQSCLARQTAKRGPPFGHVPGQIVAILEGRNFELFKNLRSLRLKKSHEQPGANLGGAYPLVRAVASFG